MRIQARAARHRATVLFSVALMAAPLASNLAAQPAGEHWVATWAASPQPRAGGPPRTIQSTGALKGNPPANAPARANAPAQITGFHNQTIRMTVPVSIAGTSVRVEFSNAYGTEALRIGGAHVALDVGTGVIDPKSDRELKFGGSASFSIPPGAVAISDPVELSVPKLSELAVSVYLPEEVSVLTMHNTGLHTTYITSDETLSIASLSAVPTSNSWYFLSSVDVLAPASDGLIVAFGDSITDGATSTNDANKSWPSQLAGRLLANPATSHLAIVNQGISGNRVLRDGTGTNALARFDRDVIAQPGVKWVMILEGINDIGQGARENASPDNALTVDDLIGGMNQLIGRAHMHGIKVIGCTLTPYKGAAYYSDKGEEMREAYNQWIRTGKAFDAVVDFDKATEDPADPKQIRPEYNIRDHLHPNDAGYKAMADAVNLAIFAPTVARTTAAKKR